MILTSNLLKIRLHLKDRARAIYTADITENLTAPDPEDDWKEVLGEDKNIISKMETDLGAYETMRINIRNLLGQYFQSSSLSNEGGRKKIFYDITWELPLFIAYNFKPQEQLGSVLVLSGGAIDAYATNCEEYLTRWWGRLGQLLLRSVQALLDNSNKGNIEQSGTKFKLTKCRRTQRSRGYYCPYARS
jgi:hypothetical protein